jgi:ATP-dependent helicase/nuclease subunit B
MSVPHVYTVPLGRPFLTALAEALLAGELPRPGGKPPSPIALSQMTLLLPTRRAARALGDAFLAASGGKAMLLPRIRPISEGQEDLALLQQAPVSSPLGGDLDVAPAVSEIERRLVLTQLVLRWSKALRGGGDPSAPLAAAGATTPAQAANLAAELAQLMDMVETEGASLAGLEKLVPEDYSSHWAQTLAFLRIVTEMWPLHLSETGRLDPAARRNAVIFAEAERLAAHPPAAPVIVAGVTGSIPATVALMRAVGALPHGAIVLPAFDSGLTAESAARIATDHPEHPQFGLAKLIGALGVTPEQVRTLAGRTVSASLVARQRMVAEAMRPAPTLELWQRYVAETPEAELGHAVAGLGLIEAPTADDEAEAVALILREAVERPGVTAALVSPDRLLARRVVNRLETMGLAVDDSAGRPLAKTPPGAFLVLVVEAFSTEFAPVALMALLKHPLCRVGRSVSDIRRTARAIELIGFRTPYLGRGLDGVLAALDAAEADLVVGARRQRAVRRLRDEDRAAARALVADLVTAFAPLARLGEGDIPQSLKAWARAHAEAAEVLARVPPPDPAAAVTPSQTGELVPSPLWQGEAGLSAHAFFGELSDESVSAPEILGVDYPELYRGLTAGVNVRPRVPAHPRISIWGPFEARLQQPDVIVLGALNDGIWPASADPGAWLNRPMRAELGLPSPEEKIGYAAHDFTALLGAEQVYLTRAAKIDGVPSVPSRWLMRLTALLDGAAARFAKDRTARHLLQPRQTWLAWARARDSAVKAKPIVAPAPAPDVAWRPRQLPVTAVERWLANPYAIYAQHVLRLEKLDPLGTEPGAALKGQIIHDALHRFAARYPRDLPADPAAELLEAARVAMAAYAAHPRVAAFWLPRFARFAQWFAETEPARRQGVDRVIAEKEGATILPAPFKPFKLTARADRLDIGAAGVTLIDYKTGRAPPDNRVLSGTSPQLPLEAAIALDGGFAGISKPAAVSLAYIRVSGGEPPGEFKRVKTDDAIALAEQVRRDLERLIAKFDDPATPYRAARRQAFAGSYDYDDFAHLARVAEWSGGDDDNGEEG